MVFIFSKLLYSLRSSVHYILIPLYSYNTRTEVEWAVRTEDGRVVGDIKRKRTILGIIIGSEDNSKGEKLMKPKVN